MKFIHLWEQGKQESFWDALAAAVVFIVAIGLVILLAYMAAPVK